MKYFRKKMMSIALVIAMITALIPLGSLTAYAVSASFTVHDTAANVDYNCTLNGANTVSIALESPSDSIAENLIIPQTVSPDGSSDTYTVTEIAYEGFLSDNALKSVTIPDSVTIVSGSAFYSCENLESVTLASSPDVSSPAMVIGYAAFAECTSLTSVDIPDKVTSLGKRAFSGCSNLEDLTLASDPSVTSPALTIGEDAFDSAAITELVIPDRVSSIGDSAFAYCESLETVDLSNDPEDSLLTAIGPSAFNSCYSLETISIPDQVTLIDEEAFAFCTKLTSVTFGAGSTLDTIGDSAFFDCEKLNSFDIPASVTSIADEAFAYDKCMTSFSIPANVTSIGDGAFGYCVSLGGIVVDSGNTSFISDDRGVLYDHAKTALIQYPAMASEGTYTIPSTVSDIKAAAFAFSKLASIEVPSSVSSIGEDAFACCYKLEAVTFGSGISLQAIGSGAFSYDAKLSQIEIPASVLTIDESAFRNDTSLAQATFEAGSLIDTIKDYAFANCPRLTDLELPQHLSKIDGNPFAGCTSLSAITIGAGNTNFAVTYGALYDISTADGDDFELVSYALASSYTTVNIPADITKVNDDALVGATNLTSVTVDSGNPEYISTDGVLYLIGSQELVYYPQGKNATSFTLPATVLNAQIESFNNSKYLLDINVQSGSPQFSSKDGVLFNREGEFLRVYPSARTATSYVIPDGTDALSDCAFANCPNLTAVICPVSLYRFRPETFANSNITLYVAAGSRAEQLAITYDLPYTTAAFGNTDENHSGGNGGGGNGGGTPNTQKEETSTTGTGKDAVSTIKTELTGTTTNGTSKAVLDTDTMKNLTDTAAKAEKTGGKAVIDITVKTDSAAKAADVTIPSDSFDSMASGTGADLKIKTGLGTVVFNASSVDSISRAASGDVSITIEKMDSAKLSSDIQKTVGDRPVYSFSVSSGGTNISSFGNGGQAEISLPYKLKAGENANAIVVYYVDASGALQNMKGHYDSKTGTVTFVTNHFSEYMIGYHKVSFSDVADGAWYADAITFISARDITTGTGNGAFSPNAKLTRGQFLVMVMKAYDISAEESPRDNFSDAGNTYYTGYLAAAKELGITAGIGNNKYAPEKEITRQEMFTLLYNTLKQIDALPANTTEKALTDYSDADDVASWAKDAVTLFVGTGTISGSNGKLNPTDTTNRAQMAQVLFNLISK